jgi:hypothetical protein
MTELIYVSNPIAQALTILLEECKALELFDYKCYSPQNASADRDLFLPLLLDEEPFGGGGGDRDPSPRRRDGVSCGKGEIF